MLELSVQNADYKFIHKYVLKFLSYHCPKYNLDLRIKTEPVTVGAAALVNI